MSGKRHHFVPQFLQRGFSSHASGDALFTWVYRKGQEPFNTNILNVGVEGHFYSDEGDTQVDDAITAAEGRFGTLVDALRSAQHGEQMDSTSLAELVAHFEIRTRHLRQNFQSIGGVVLDQLLRFVADQDAFGAYIKRRIQNDSSFLRDSLADELKKRGLPDALLPQLLALSRPLVPNMLPSLLADFSAVTDQLRKNAPTMIETAAKSGHLKGLKQALAPPVKTNQYRDLSFSVKCSATPLFPLGDSMVIFHFEGERTYKSFSEKDERVEAVYLPLSPTHVLVGHRDGYEPDLAMLPLAIVQCSLEYFIANAHTKFNAALHTHIGETAFLLSQAQIEVLLNEAMNE